MCCVEAVVALEEAAEAAEAAEEAEGEEEEEDDEEERAKQAWTEEAIDRAGAKTAVSPAKHRHRAGRASTSARSSLPPTLQHVAGGAVSARECEPATEPSVGSVT